MVSNCFITYPLPLCAILQYTAPKYMELDIRHTLCATCDLPLVPAHDLGKVLKHGVTTAAEKLKQAAAKAKVLWAKMDKCKYAFISLLCIYVGYFLFLVLGCRV